MKKNVIPVVWNNPSFSSAEAAAVVNAYRRDSTEISSFPSAAAVAALLSDALSDKILAEAEYRATLPVSTLCPYRP